MEYPKIIHLLDNTPNQPSKFRTKNQVDTNDELHQTYNNYSKIKFKTCIHAYIIITVSNIGTAAASNNRNKEVVFKNCAS